MAIPAIDSVVLDVMLVAELDWLLACDANSRDEGALVNLVGCPHNSRSDQRDGHDADLCEAVRTAVKELRHVRLPSLSASTEHNYTQQICCGLGHRVQAQIYLRQMSFALKSFVNIFNTFSDRRACAHANVLFLTDWWGLRL